MCVTKNTYVLPRILSFINKKKKLNKLAITNRRPKGHEEKGRAAASMLTPASREGIYFLLPFDWPEQNPECKELWIITTYVNHSSRERTCNINTGTDECTGRRINKSSRRRRSKRFTSWMCR